MPTPYATGSTSANGTLIGNQRINEGVTSNEPAVAADKTDNKSNVTEINKENFKHVIRFSEVPEFYRKDPAAFSKLVQMFIGGTAQPVMRFTDDPE